MRKFEMEDEPVSNWYQTPEAFSYFSKYVTGVDQKYWFTYLPGHSLPFLLF